MYYFNSGKAREREKIMSYYLLTSTNHNKPNTQQEKLTLSRYAELAERNGHIFLAANAKLKQADICRNQASVNPLYATGLNRDAHRLEHTAYEYAEQILKRGEYGFGVNARSRREAVTLLTTMAESLSNHGLKLDAKKVLNTANEWLSTNLRKIK